MHRRYFQLFKTFSGFNSLLCCNVVGLSYKLATVQLIAESAGRWCKVWFSFYSSLSQRMTNMRCLDLGLTNYLITHGWNIQLLAETTWVGGLHSDLPLTQTNGRAGEQELPRCPDGNLVHWAQDTLPSRPNAQYEKEQPRVNAVTEHLNLQTATLATWQLKAVIYSPNTGVIYSNWADIVQSGGEPSGVSAGWVAIECLLHLPGPEGPANLR